MQTPRTLTRAQSRELDRRATAEFGVPSIVLMENAGRGATDTLQRLGLPGPVVICCGKGNNAGDGFVIARHLDLRGMAVRLLLWADPDSLAGDAAVNFQIARAAGIDCEVMHGESAADAGRRLAGAGCVVDALLGTGAAGEPRPPLDAAIDAVNAAGVPILAVDVPSGLDCDTGQPAGHTVRAAHTCTFVAVKPGLLAPQAAGYVGQLHVLDIGAPRVLVEQLLAAAETGTVAGQPPRGD